MLPDSALELATEVVRLFQVKSRKMAFAESCSGGLLAAAITYVSGASDVFERGFVTYANEAKHEELKVPSALIRQHGAVSKEVAEAMAKGVRQVARADVGVSITGIAGPTGGSEHKPVGLVYIGIATAKSCEVKRFNFPGGRKDVRGQTVMEALKMLKDYIRQQA
ncbi:MAG TPA: CinA family protein [Alphaproteobacteria bacterium]|nr:CinA family protein [Alphaproteobacteria bacterium]